MRSERTTARTAAAGVLILVGWAVSEARASTARLPEDRSLVAASDLIAEVTVLHESAGVPGRLPSIEYTVLVDRVLNGRPAPSTLIVRVPGGAAGGREFLAPGSPRLDVEGRALLFLRRASDGAWLPLHLGLGVFRAASDGAGRIAVRSWPEPATARVRDYDRFVGWVARAAAGDVAPADYWRRRHAAAFRAAYELSWHDGRAVRWFEFDQAGQVGWSVSGDRPAAAEAALGRALAAWSGIPGSPIRLVYAGPNASSAGFDAHDGENTVLFGDPGELIGGRFRCDEGGVLALGGWWIDGREGVWEGSSYYRVIEGDVVVNDGVDCLDDADLAEMLTHELGHPLGLEHACGDAESGACDTASRNEAIMRSYLHGGGRGARLAGDDRKGAVRLYGGDPVDDGEAAELEAPAGLVASWAAGGSVRLAWRDVEGEKRYQVQMRRPGVRFVKVATEKRDVSSTTIPVTAAGGERVEFRVRAVRGKVRSAFSEVATIRIP